jgi:radical SAM superfamily enzyme YgiQ (UPF0313 family)
MLERDINNQKQSRILLALLPFWEPQIPPMGLACIKGYLEKFAYPVQIADANIREEFNDIHQRYFDCLQESIPEDKQGNFSNIGHEVFRNHLMVHLNYTDEKKYLELVMILIYHTFYITAAEDTVRSLNGIIEDFYHCLEGYLFKLLDQDKIDVLGLSVFKGNLPASMFAFRWVREKYPHIKTVMGGAVFAGTLTVGGPNFANFLEKTRDYIDKIIVGEGEVLFLKWLEGELDESKRVYTLEDINHDVLDLSQTGLPDFSGLELKFYPNMAAYTSRSCPFQCSFCTETIYWGNYRKKNPAQVVEELRLLYEKYGYQLFLMCDSLLNPTITDLANALIEADMSIYWDGYLRVDRHVCDAEKVLLWRRGGFWRARLGMESGSPRVLESMGKKITPDQMRTAIINLANVGIKTTTYWVIGHPGETEEDFQQTLDMIEELKDSIYESWCSPFYYYVSGQVHSQYDPWAQKSRLLYPVEAGDMLVAQTWIVDSEPSREEVYKRVNRFVRQCERLGIPNPYSMLDFYRADERWHRLHKNAVPSIVEFENRDKIIDENKRVKKLVTAEQKLSKEMDFGF